MRIHGPLFILLARIAAAVSSSPVAGQQLCPTPLTLQMLDSIIAREQGVSVNASVKTSVIEAGLLLMGIDEVLEKMVLSNDQRAKYESYLDLVISGVVPALANETADATAPLDEFSVGTQVIKR